MKKNDMPELMGIFVALCGVIVMMGWFLDIGILKSILPGWVTMKFSTALAFFFSGVILYFIVKARKGRSELAGVIIPVASLVIFLLMGTLIGSTFLGVSLGVEEMFVRESMKAVGSVTPGRPSVVTMVNFLLIASCGIVSVFDAKKFGNVLMGAGALVCLVGLTALFGYILGQPVLYFMVPGKSSAMACHTAILFVLWGLGITLSQKEQ